MKILIEVVGAAFSVTIDDQEIVTTLKDPELVIFQKKKEESPSAICQMGGESDFYKDEYDDPMEAEADAALARAEAKLEKPQHLCGHTRRKFKEVIDSASDAGSCSDCGKVFTAGQMSVWTCSEEAEETDCF